MINEIFNKIKDSKKIAIFTHIRPDGDCLGAGMALYYWCKALKKEVAVFNADNIHDNFSFLTKGLVKKELDKEYDTHIAVDTASLSRLGALQAKFKKAPITISIDHHISNDGYAKLNYIDAESSSCCEVLYDFFEQNKQSLTKEIAHALLSGVSSDTGCFRHSNTTSKTHFIASKLMEFDIDIDEMNYYLFRIKSKAEINLMLLMYENLKYFSGGVVAITGFDKKDILKAKAQFKDDPYLIDDLIGIEGVKIAITYKQDVDNGFNVSFRSNGDIDVCELAKCFGGGGHKNSSGCKVYLSRGKLIEELGKKASEFVK